MAVIVLGGLLLACGTVEPRPTTSNDSLIAGPPLPARTVFPPNNDWNRDVSPDSVMSIPIRSSLPLRRRGRHYTPTSAPGTGRPVGHSVCDRALPRSRACRSRSITRAKAIPVRIRFHRT